MILLQVALERSHIASAAICAIGHLLSLGAVLVVAASGDLPRGVTPLLSIDGYGLFFQGLLAAGGLAVSLLSYGYLKKRETEGDEYYLLLLMATLGSQVLAVSSHF